MVGARACGRTHCEDVVAGGEALSVLAELKIAGSSVELNRQDTRPLAIVVRPVQRAPCRRWTSNALTAITYADL